MKPENDNTIPVASINRSDVQFLSNVASEALDVNINWMVINTKDERLSPQDILFFNQKDKATNHCWDNFRGNSELIVLPVAEFLLAITDKVAGKDQATEDSKELTVKIPKDQIADFRDSPKNKNLENLQAQLIVIQHGNDLTPFELFAHMQKNKENFQLKHTVSSYRKDSLNFTLEFIKNQDNTYSLNHIDAALRRAIQMPGPKAVELESKMKATDWEIALYDHKPGRELLLSVQNIQKELEALASTGPHGELAAENLKFRYWSDTPLEYQIENLKGLKPLYESSHRFSGDELELTSQEAFLLLSTQLSERLDRYKDLMQFPLFNNKNEVMNNENLEFLQDNLKYLGFGEKLQLHSQLEEQIGKQPKDFQLKTEAIFDENKKMEAVLHFRKSDQLDMYFFNKYDAKLKDLADPEKDRSQTFYITKGSGVTLKEAYNLLSGRSVNKDLYNMEGNKYNAWLKLDFSEKDAYNNFKVNKYVPNYGFDIESKLDKLPVQEANPTHAKYEATIRSLKKGNLTKVHSLGGEEVFIAANPPAGKLEVFDANKNPIELKRAPQASENQTSKPTAGNTQDNGNGADLGTGQSAGKNKNSQKKNPPTEKSQATQKTETGQKVKKEQTAPAGDEIDNRSRSRRRPGGR